MEKTISAAEANRRFSALLRGVRDGESYIITSHGTPVATLAPVDAAKDANESAFRDRAYRRLMEHLRSRPVIDIGPWTREEMYEDEK